MFIYKPDAVNYPHRWIIISNFKHILTPRDPESLRVAEPDDELKTPKISAAN